MKIAVSCNENAICEHFGPCECFRIFDAEDGRIASGSVVPNPGHKPGFLPNFLADQGVNVVIAGSMGAGAADLFAARGIQVITGAAGDAREAAEACLRGELHSTGAVCRGHEENGHDCGGHCAT